MARVSALLNYLKNNISSAKSAAPEGYCPNCWGRQEYEGQFLEAVKTNSIDVNSKDPNLGWVQEYANKHLAGIELQTDDDQLVCQNCKITYRRK